VNLMGGEMGIKSEPGAGSTFSFTVTFEKQPEHARPARDVPADLAGRRALVVDDNRTNRTILEKQLSSWGVLSVGVEGGQEALEELRTSEEPYDLAVLDMQMPGMDGMELARRIKGDPDLSRIRLALLTSMGHHGEGEEASQSGIEAYLKKPVRQSDLYDAIVTVMSGAAQDEKRLVTLRDLPRQMAGTHRVLVAEDNPVNQKVAARMLENLGYQVDVVGDGKEAVEAITGTRYGAVLMDVQMPGMDGYRATRRIRLREDELGRRNMMMGLRRHRTPIIAMTANAMQGDREKALQAGMDDYIAKPVKREDLDSVLERWIPRQEPPAQGDGDPGSPAVELSVLESRRGPQKEGEPDKLARIVGLFIEDVPIQLAAIRRAAERGESQEVEEKAHMLKGGSGYMGAARMAQMCARLEQLGASGDLAPVPELLDAIEREFGRVRPALSAAIAKN
jgi:two-component system, sensor histidine kinase and response regulator